jgi:hypothetical protein
METKLGTPLRTCGAEKLLNWKNLQVLIPWTKDDDGVKDGQCS